MNNSLVIFDIDGTLTDTNAVDDECYCRAVADVLGLNSSEIDWADAPHVTDSGIADWLWKRHRDRPPTMDEVSHLRRRFMALLEDQAATAPERFAAIKGANEVVDRLVAAAWTVALATGGWYMSAAMKLRLIGLSPGTVAMASADDSHSREEIVQLAQRRAETRASGQFQPVVSVGDAPWDVRTACKLGMPFVGVGSGPKAERLRVAGAAVVVADLTYEPLLQALTQARVPVPDATDLQG
nr:HAD family hydrolase [Gemmatimonadaceae bacterium]